MPLNTTTQVVGGLGPGTSGPPRTTCVVILKLNCGNTSSPGVYLR
jgi:hypothetical protein